MTIGGQLASLDEPVHRFLLPDGCVAVHEIDHAGFAHEEAAIDQANVCGVLLAEGLHDGRIIREAHDAETAGRRNGGHGCAGP